MGVDFSDLIPAKPQTSGAATGGISFDDLIPKPSDAASASPSAVAAPAEPSGQSPGTAVVSAGMQGLVGGTGQVVAGVGRQATAAAIGTTQRQLAVMDRIDRGERVADQDDSLGYQYLSDADKAKARADLTAAATEQARHEPNLLERGGVALEKGAPTWFPVDPQQEGYATGIARGVGGFVPVAGAGALGSLAGGPVGGMLAANAAVGAQTYDETYQDQIAHGASHEQADKAAGEAAEGAMAIGAVVPAFGRVLRYIPVLQRPGFLKTAVNLAADNIEFPTIGAANQFAQNYVASQTYDPGRPLFKDTGDAVLNAFLAGKVVHGVGAGVGALGDALRPGPRAQPADIANRVMEAPTIEGAITAATEAAQGGGEPPAAEQSGAAPAATAAPEPTPQPTYGDLFSRLPSSEQSPVLTTASGAKHPYRWDVAEADSLIPASGDLQPRDRAGRAASGQQVADIAGNLDPALLRGSPGPDQGAPTVTADGTILAGNGRTAAIRRAYVLGNADPYRAMIERYGLDTTGMNRPVLVRRLTTDLTPDEARNLAVESNVPTGQRMSGTEQAAVDARSLTPDLLTLYNPELTGGPLAAGNRDFVRQWVATLPQTERNAVQDANGVLSADGVRRLQGGMLAMGYGDKGTLARALESTDDATRSLTGALTDAAPAFAQLQARIQDGAVPPMMNIAPAVIHAVELVRLARQKGLAVADVLAQQDAFNPVDPVTHALVRAFYNADMTRQASRALIGEVLRRYAIEAGQTSTEAGLFGNALPALTPDQVLRTVVAAARNELPDLPEMPEPVPPQPAPTRITTAQGQARDGVGGVEAQRRAAAENAAAAAEVVNGWRRMQPGEPLMPGQEVATDQHGQQWVRADINVPQPRPVGAQAATAPIPAKTRAQALRDLKYAIQQSAEDRAGPQQIDNNAYVAGAERTLAARHFNDPVHARDEKVAMAKDPEFRRQVEAIRKNSNDAMNDLLRNDAQDDIALDAAYDYRNEVTPGALGIFRGEKSVDASGLIDDIDTLIDSPEGKVGGVERVLQGVRDSLHDRNGNLESLPSRLYGVRRNITTLLQKGAKGTTDQAMDIKVSKALLESLLPTIDALISRGAPRFASEYLPAFHERSIPIDQMEFLQQYQNGPRKLTGQDGYLLLSKVNAMLAEIAKLRSAPGVNKAKSLTPEQIENILAVRNELAAESLRVRKAAVSGSDTFQQLEAKLEPQLTPTAAAVRSVATTGGHLALGLTTHGAGNVVFGGIQGVKAWQEARQQQQARAAIAARKAELLQTNRGYVETP